MFSWLSRKSSACAAASMPSPYADREAFETNLSQMLDKMCSKKKTKLCEKYGIAQESEWTQEQCFTVLAKCAVKKDLEGCVQIFRQWHALLMTEQQEHIARLEQECSKHKRAAISAQKT